MTLIHDLRKCNCNIFLRCKTGWLLAEAIRLEHVEVPSVVAVGEAAHLNCEIDLEQDELYSVKWYKDSEEFYEVSSSGAELITCPTYICCSL